MAQVLLRPRARRDLNDIGDYIAERSGDESADRVLDRIARTLDTQAQYPLTGRHRDELRPGLRSIPSGRYVIFYVPLPDGIRVVRVLHGARDISSLFDLEPDADD